jgi:hypothetical protein
MILLRRAGAWRARKAAVPVRGGGAPAAGRQRRRRRKAVALAPGAAARCWGMGILRLGRLLARDKTATRIRPVPRIGTPRRLRFSRFWKKKFTAPVLNTLRKTDSVLSAAA